MTPLHDEYIRQGTGVWHVGYPLTGLTLCGKTLYPTTSTTVLPADNRCSSSGCWKAFFRLRFAVDQPASK